MNTRTRKLVYTALFAALTAVGAFLRIPMVYSSVTLQYLFTAMAGAAAGSEVGRFEPGGVRPAGAGGPAHLHHGRRLWLCVPAHVRVPAGADPGRMGGGCRGRGESGPQTHGTGVAGGTGRAVRRGNALHGLDTQRLHGQGYDVFRAAVGGDAALPAGRRSEDHRGGGRVPRFAAAVKIGGWQR